MDAEGAARDRNPPVSHLRNDPAPPRAGFRESVSGSATDPRASTASRRIPPERVRGRYGSARHSRRERAARAEEWEPPTVAQITPRPRPAPLQERAGSGGAWHRHALDVPGRSTWQKARALDRADGIREPGHRALSVTPHASGGPPPGGGGPATLQRPAAVLWRCRVPAPQYRGRRSPLGLQSPRRTLNPTPAGTKPAVQTQFRIEINPAMQTRPRGPPPPLAAGPLA